MARSDHAIAALPFLAALLLPAGAATADPGEPGFHFDLTVTIEGNGRVVSDRPTTDSQVIDCPGQCVASIATDATATLEATPDPGWEFAGWSGDCIGTGSCSVVIDQNRNVTATFRFVGGPPQALSVEVQGPGEVHSTPGGISCPDDCVTEYEFGTTVSLLESPDREGRFVRWTGDCTGSGQCTVEMDRLRTVGAVFEGQPRELRVEVAGEGRVRSTPSGIDCPDACVASFPGGASVQLVAEPAEGWLFARWGGACAGSGTCRIGMDDDRRVTATFVEATSRLTVSVSGEGTVASDPPGIACPPDCAADFANGTNVALTPAPAAGWELDAWGGACSGAGDCVVSVDADETVTASFTRRAVRLEVRVTGRGSVGSSPSGIACPETCVEEFVSGTRVTLDAEPAAGWTFAGWREEPCSGTGSCAWTLEEDVTMVAAFATSDRNVDTTSPGSADRVDGHDLARMMEAIASGDPRFDLNGDGSTDLSDLNLVLQDLGRSP